MIAVEAEIEIVDESMPVSYTTMIDEDKFWVTDSTLEAMSGKQKEVPKTREDYKVIWPSAILLENL